MKKFFAIAVIAISIVACNNSGKGKGDKDTTKVDSPVVNPPVNDSVPPVTNDSVPPVVKDSVH